MKVLAGFTKLEPYIVPDAFSISFIGNEETAKIEYEESGIIDTKEDKESIKSQFEALHNKFGSRPEDMTYEISDNHFSIKETRTEEKEVALARIFNELIFQMKCYYSDSDIHKMVDSIVVSEVLEEGSSSSFSFPGRGSLPGIGFYVNFPSVNSSVVGFDNLISLIEISGSFSTMHRRSGDVLFNSSVENRFTGVDSTFDEVLVSSPSVADHLYHKFMNNYNKNLLQGAF